MNRSPQQESPRPGDLAEALHLLVQQGEQSTPPAAGQARPRRWAALGLAAVGGAMGGLAYRWRVAPAAGQARPLRWAVLGLAVAGVALGGLVYRWRAAPAPASAPATAAMTAANFARAPAAIMKVSGFFSAHELVEISATVLARVKSIRVREGMSVRQGELLVELSNVRGDEDVLSAQERLAAENLGAEKAALDLRHELEEQKRQTSLFAQGFGTRQAMAQADLRVDESRLELARTRRSVADVLANLRAVENTRLEYAIRAPFSGIVVAQNARVGEVVSPTNGGSHIRSGLLALLNPATLEVEVSVQERLLPQLRSAGCALVSSLAQPDQIRDVPFQLSRISNTADRQRGAVTALLVPLRPMRVLPILQTSAEVEFIRAGDNRCSPSSIRASMKP